MKISIMFVNFGRPERLEQTLPYWLSQVGVDYEIVVGVAKENLDNKILKNKKIKAIELPFTEFKYSSMYNYILNHCSGELLLITQADLYPQDKNMLKNMLKKYKDKTMVTQKFFDGDLHDEGLFLQCMLVSKAEIVNIGGWSNEYDKGYAFEDADVIARLINNGNKYIRIETEKEKAVLHIPHARPDKWGAFAKKYHHNLNLYYSRFPSSIMALEEHGRIPDYVEVEDDRKAL